MILFRIVNITDKEMEFFSEQIQHDSAFKGALMLMRSFHRPDSERSSKKFFKYDFMMVPIVIFTKKEFYLLKAINGKLESLKASGLMTLWHAQDTEKQFEHSKEQKEHPKLLTLEMLTGCFQVLIAGYLLSCIIFLIETKRAKNERWMSI